MRFEEATDPLSRLRLAIVTHAQVYNSTDVDEDFVVPETWPQPLRGLELGAAVASLRRLEASANLDRRKRRPLTHKYSGEELRRDASSPRPSKTGWGRKLTEIGFEWNPINRGDDKHFSRIVSALKAYEEEHADLLLPRSFRVPSRPPYPAALAGVDLDRAVYDLSFYRTFLAGRPERQSVLRELGFCWGRLQPEFNLVIEALITYRELNGDLLVPSTYIVPNDEKWPDSTRGMPLGRRVRQIRRRNDYLGNDPARWRSLDELGFCWEPKRTKRSVVARAFRRYEELKVNPEAPLSDYEEILTNEDLDWNAAKVPRNFVIGEDDTRYPRECRGLQLGARVAAYRRPLAKSREGAFSQFLVELERYVAEHETADVPQNYKTKSGYPLGTRVAAVRSRGQYLVGEMKEERRRRLDQLGFVWKKQKGRRRVST